jgi:hypothetical protein
VVQERQVDLSVVGSHKAPGYGPGLCAVWPYDRPTLKELKGVFRGQARLADHHRNRQDVEGGLRYFH